ncbi:MAG: inositol monophosphatase family protein [Patescibacteria group bacterium]
MNDQISNQIAQDILNLAPKIINDLNSEFIKSKFARLTQAVVATGNNGAQDIVTELDHAIGKMYIEQIYKKYSEYIRIDSEEENERIGTGKIVLRFDPVDGSKHFATGITEIASAAALSVNDVPFFAMVIDPFANHVYHAFKDGGAFLNGTKISVNQKNISDDFSFLMYEAPNSKLFQKDNAQFVLQSKQLDLISQSAYRLRNKGLSSTSICLVADGSACAYIDFSSSTKLYDVEAAVLIAQEAGAIVTSTRGGEISQIGYITNSDKKEITANLVIANPTAVNDILKILK